MDEFQEFLDEYDDLAQRLIGSRYQEFPAVAQRFLQLLQRAPEPSASRLTWLRGLMPIERVEAEVLKEPTGMVGSGRMVWPKDFEQALSGQLNLLASFTGDENAAWQFAHNYFYSRSNNINDTLHEMTEHLYDPMIRDLRRYLQRNKDKPIDVTQVPASDRIVHLDHNKPEYTATLEAIEAAHDAALASNEIDPDDRDRVKFELDAGILLIKASSVRLAAIEAVLIHALKWLVAGFAGNALAHVAEQALQAVLKLLAIS
ncbi:MULTISPECIES: hypothetical protein [unclassified Mesorhizobium]|uniref:hypothetical protein n=1 Tax=unclassified Mesorhizobium TaxID=325217 RepID=UPI0011271C38|nr:MULTISPECIES: hypothetical protein [unclassified Mesorhizobium]TPJ77182.1 hypothetical protein FJ419_16810 [Mesorhizobium sp. B2-6-2]TPO13727.1 hypothetical protein FJ980_00680 [Mesorhizobium sp. B1-1-5]